MLKRNPLRSISHYAFSVAIVALCSSALWRIPAITAGAAAPVLLLAVLLIARSWGTGPGLAGSVCAGLAFMYYFPDAGEQYCTLDPETAAP